MKSINIKSLIIGFLLCAVAISLSYWLTSYFKSNFTAQTASLMCIHDYSFESSEMVVN